MLRHPWKTKSRGKVTVAFLDPDIMVKLVNKPEVQGVATEARTRLERARDSLKP
jgi:hypothetical protein